MNERFFAVVTGANGGLGLALCEGLIGCGWNVIGVSRRPSSLNRLNYEHILADLSSTAGLQAASDAIFSILGRKEIDEILVINNAATVSPTGFYCQSSPDSLQESFVLNVVSPMWLSQKFLHDFPDVKVKIFNVFSGAGQRPIAGWAAYCSTKAALKMSAQTLHEEIPLCKRTKPCGIFVYDPGVIDTQMQAEIRGLQKDEFPSASYFSDLAEQGKLRKPDDVAVEIIKLCNGKIERDFYLEDRIRS